MPTACYGGTLEGRSLVPGSVCLSSASVVATEDTEKKWEETTAAAEDNMPPPTTDPWLGQLGSSRSQTHKWEGQKLETTSLPWTHKRVLSNCLKFLALNVARWLYRFWAFSCLRTFRPSCFVARPMRASENMLLSCLLARS